MRYGRASLAPCDAYGCGSAQSYVGLRVRRCAAHTASWCCACQAAHGRRAPHHRTTRTRGHAGCGAAASCATAMDSQAAFIGHHDTDLAFVRYAISLLHGMAAARPAGFHAEQAVAHDDCLAKQGFCARAGYRVRRRLCCMGRSSFAARGRSRVCAGINTRA